MAGIAVRDQHESCGNSPGARVQHVQTILACSAWYIASSCRFFRQRRIENERRDQSGAGSVEQRCDGHRDLSYPCQRARAGLQPVNNPAYNRARRPVSIIAMSTYRRGK
jgi:hypothetical protein